jgi:hypothetical protein
MPEDKDDSIRLSQQSFIGLLSMDDDVNRIKIPGILPMAR